MYVSSFRVYIDCMLHIWLNIADCMITVFIAFADIADCMITVYYIAHETVSADVLRKAEC